MNIISYQTQDFYKLLHLLVQCVVELLSVCSQTSANCRLASELQSKFACSAGNISLAKQVTSSHPPFT